MGNCQLCTGGSQNFIDSTQRRDKSLYDGRYTKVTFDQYISEMVTEEAFYLKYINPWDELRFQIQVAHFRLSKLLMIDEVYLSCEIGRDNLKKPNKKKMKASALGLDDTEKATITSEQENMCQWNSETFKVDSNGSCFRCQIDFEIHHLYECSFEDMKEKFFIIKLYSPQVSPSPISYVMIDLLSLATGPKHLDFEVKSFKTHKTIGRLQLDMHFKQVQTVEVLLNSLTCKFSGKQEKPHYALFKAITTHDVPKISENSATKLGLYNKAKNQTTFKWDYIDDLNESPNVCFDVSLECLKSSTLQICIFIDRYYINESRHLLYKRINKSSMLANLDVKRVRDNDPEEISPQMLQLQKNNSMSFGNDQRSSLLQYTSAHAQKENSSRQSFDQKVSDDDDDFPWDKAVSPESKTIANRQSYNFNYNSPQTNHLKKTKTLSYSKGKVQRQYDALDYYRGYSVGTSQEDKEDWLGDLNGECYVGFQKLLQTELRMLDRRDSFILSNKLNINSSSVLQESQSMPTLFRSKSLQSRIGHQEKKNFNEKLWVLGKVVGTLKGQFELRNMPVLQQMQLGILTENGIQINSAPILIEENESLFLGFLKRQNNNETISQLIKLVRSLKQLDNFKNRKQANRVGSEKEKTLCEIKGILLGHDTQAGQHMFYYHDEKDMLRAQKTLIELAFHCLMFVESVRYDLRCFYYDIISLSIDRDELRLANVAISDKIVEASAQKDQDPSSSSGHTDPAQSIIQQKLKLGEYYQKLLYSILEDCLHKFYRKDVEPYLRTYLETCISLAFFRVPEFRKLFLQCISSQNDDDLTHEWRGINWPLIDEDETNVEASVLQLFRWDQYFYNCLPKTPEQEESQKILLRIKKNEKWQSRLKKRSTAFFQIIKRWCDSVFDNVKAHSIFWQDLPGYRQILKAILCEMKALEIFNYPDSLIEATLSFLHNTELLTVFISILFNKTNAYDSYSLCTSISIATQWITHIEKLGSPFPSNFDFSFYFRGICIALEMDHSVSTPRTLWCLYKTLHYYPADNRNVLVEELLKKMFFKLFFSWSYNIRDLFYSLLLYQIEYSLVDKSSKDMGIELDFYFKKSASLRPSFKLKRKQTINLLTNQLSLIENELIKANSDNTNSVTKRNSVNELNDQQSKKIQENGQMQKSSQSFSRKRVSKTSSNATLSVKTIKIQKLLSRRLKEIDTIDEYLSLQSKVRNSQSPKAFEESISSMAEANDDLAKTEEETHRKDIEIKYNKILRHIPKQYHVYIPQAINEYHKQVEEYEKWKGSLKGSPSEGMPKLPEFNMDSYLPVEDDLNLEKKEEW